MSISQKEKNSLLLVIQIYDTISVVRWQLSFEPETMRIYDKLSITSLYYFGTPLFMMLDYFGGINVRVAVLDSFPLYKKAYYGFCIVCGVGMFALPR